jgi:hypothetical protein
MLVDDDFGQTPGKYPGPTNLVEEATWKSIVGLPDDARIRTSDAYGSQLQTMWEYWGMWTRVVLGVQELYHDPTKSPTAIAAIDVGDEFQAGTYAALVGYYRVAFSCLRNVLEQITIAAQLAISKDGQDFTDWRNGEERIRFGWAADMLLRNAGVAASERHLKSVAQDSVFDQSPKGLARRLFAEFSKYTRGVAGFTDADVRQSNGPIFLPRTFLEWCVASLKTYAVALHILKLVQPALDSLPWGPPSVTLDEFRRRVVADIPWSDGENALFQALVDFWP